MREKRRQRGRMGASLIIRFACRLWRPSFFVIFFFFLRRLRRLRCDASIRDIHSLNSTLDGLSSVSVCMCVWSQVTVQICHFFCCCLVVLTNFLLNFSSSLLRLIVRSRFSRLLFCCPTSTWISISPSFWEEGMISSETVLSSCKYTLAGSTSTTTTKGPQKEVRLLDGRVVIIKNLIRSISRTLNPLALSKSLESSEIIDRLKKPNLT